MWERNSWRPRTVLQVHTPVDNIIFSHDGSLLVASVREKADQSRLYVWDAHSLALRYKLPVIFSRPELYSFSIRNLWLSPDNTLLAARAASSSYGRSSSIALWDMKNGQRLYTLPEVEDIAFSFDSRFLTGVREGSGASWHKSQPDVMVYQARDGKMIRAFNLNPPPKRYFYGNVGSSSGAGSGVHYDLSPNGRRVAVGLKKASTRRNDYIIDYGGALWVDTTGQQSTQVLSENEYLQIFSHDGSRILTTDATNYWESENRQQVIRIRDTQNRQLLSSWKLQPREYATEFSPDNALVLTYDLKGVRRLREANTGRLKGKLKQESTTFNLRFSPDGTWIGSTGFDFYDTRALLWDTQTSQLVRRLEGHRRSVKDMAFSPDSRTLATASDDGSVKLWRLR